MTKVMFITKGGEYFPPMGIMQLSAMAKKAGHAVNAGIMLRENVFDKIKREQPDVIAYSGSTGEHKYYFEINRRIKETHGDRVKTIMGGPHATFFPEKTLEEAGLDAVCIGEGDYSFPEFLERAGKNQGFEDLENIMTCSGKKRPRLKPLVQDLDSLPFPDREVFYGIGESSDNPIKHFFVSRGCPYNCTYCFNKPFREMYSGQRYIRKRSVENILEEITKVKEKWPLEYPKFYDDVFTLRADDWLREFSDKYSKRIGLPFFCLVRADTVNEEMVNLLADAGCKAVSMSVETANERIRREIINRNMTNEQLKKAYRLMGERGIAVQSNNILGLPTSRIEDDIATMDFNIECGPKQNTKVIGEFGTAHPYPGTALYQYCEEHSLYSDLNRFKDMHMSYHDESPLNCFSPLEKRMQKNLSLLGTVAVRWPSTRNLIVDHLIKWPTNPLFFTAFYLAKTGDYMKHIYPIKYTLKDYLRVIPQSIRLDWFKRMKKI